MTSIITITTKNQVTLPVKFTRMLGLEAGTQLFVKHENDGLRLEKVPLGFADLQGIVQKVSRFKKLTVKQARARALKTEARRLMSI